MRRIARPILALAALAAAAALLVHSLRLARVSASSVPGSTAPWVTPSLFAAGRCRHADATDCVNPRYTTFEVHVPLEQAIAAGGNVAIYEGFVDDGRVVAGDLLRYRWPRVQLFDPSAPNYTTARAVSGAPVTTAGRGGPGAIHGVIVRSTGPPPPRHCTGVALRPPPGRT